MAEKNRILAQMNMGDFPHTSSLLIKKQNLQGHSLKYRYTYRRIRTALHLFKFLINDLLLEKNNNKYY